SARRTSLTANARATGCMARIEQCVVVPGQHEKRHESGPRPRKTGVRTGATQRIELHPTPRAVAGLVKRPAIAEAPFVAAGSDHRVSAAGESPRRPQAGDWACHSRTNTVPVLT